MFLKEKEAAFLKGYDVTYSKEERLAYQKGKRRHALKGTFYTSIFTLIIGLCADTCVHFDLTASS